MGKGKAPAPLKPVYTDPVTGKSFDNAQALNDAISARVYQEGQDSNAKSTQSQAEKAAADAKLASDTQLARGAARTSAVDYFKSQGVDATPYLGEIDSNLDQQYNAHPTHLTADVLFSTSTGADVLNSLLSNRRSTASSRVSSLFSPTYANDQLTSDIAAPAEQQVLDAQFNPLNDQLTNASKRGTLNAQGMTAAQAALAAARTKAQSTVSGLADNILATDRGKVNNYITGAKNDAAGVDLNSFDKFNPDTYAAGASDLVKHSKDNFAGDLSNAVGNTSFSDLTTLLNAGGVVQGATDPTITNPNKGAGGGLGSDPSSIADNVLKQRRGLGSQGSF